MGNASQINFNEQLHRSLAKFLRRPVLPRIIAHGSLRALQVRLIKIGAKRVRHVG